MTWCVNRWFGANPDDGLARHAPRRHRGRDAGLQRNDQPGHFVEEEDVVAVRTQNPAIMVGNPIETAGHAMLAEAPGEVAAELDRFLSVPSRPGAI